VKGIYGRIEIAFYTLAGELGDLAKNTSHKTDFHIAKRRRLTNGS